MATIDPKLLRAFLHVAGEGSAAAAARRLGLSRNAVSRRIRTLEARLGARLFLRTAQGMRLAPTGEGLMPAAREIVATHDRLHARAATLAAAQS